jgi:hypothetical protein
MKRIALLCLALNLQCATIYGWLGYNDRPRVFTEHENVETVPAKGETCQGKTGRALDSCIDGSLENYGRVWTGKVLPVGPITSNRIGLTDTVVYKGQYGRFYGCEKDGKKTWCETSPKLRHYKTHGCEQEPAPVRWYKKFAAWIVGAEIVIAILYFAL